jgi:hypothetical protein
MNESLFTHYNYGAAKYSPSGGSSLSVGDFIPDKLCQIHKVGYFRSILPIEQSKVKERNLPWVPDSIVRLWGVEGSTQTQAWTIPGF